MSPARSTARQRAAGREARGAANGTPRRAARASNAETERDAPEARDAGAAGDGASEVVAEPLEGPEGEREFLAAIDGGEPWYPALLEVIARWIQPEELIDGAVYRYLVGGEAFDWLRLAERLIEAAGDERVPPEEAERLLFLGAPPGGVHRETEAEFARAIGHDKYRAHLNFLYGVTVEEALLFLAELDLHKSRSSLDGPRSVPPDIAAYEHVYGRTLEELVALYRQETGTGLANRVSQSEWHAFTYWCWKFRLKWHDPARVASDTRRALAQLSLMELEGRGRVMRARASEFANIIDVD